MLKGTGLSTVSICSYRWKASCGMSDSGVEQLIHSVSYISKPLRAFVFSSRRRFLFCRSCASFAFALSLGALHTARMVSVYHTRLYAESEYRYRASRKMLSCAMAMLSVSQMVTVSPCVEKAGCIYGVGSIHAESDFVESISDGRIARHVGRLSGEDEKSMVI